MRSFLGLVRDLDMTVHTRILNAFTTKELEKEYPCWTAQAQTALTAVKRLVTGARCLTAIEHHNLGDKKILLPTNASNFRTGAALSFERPSN